MKPDIYLFIYFLKFNGENPLMKFDLRIKLDHPIVEYFSPYAV